MLGEPPGFTSHGGALEPALLLPGVIKVSMPFLANSIFETPWLVEEIAVETTPFPKRYSN